MITFGKYEQDNNLDNGKEDIEWLVLAKEEDRILVISKYALDCQRYNTANKGVTLETCTLRGWLNDTFLSKAFTDEESSMIPTVTVGADKNPIFQHIDPGNVTQDQIFLLSITETEQYFSTDEARKCVPTIYAIAQGAETNDSYKIDGKATCWWWLRSPGILADAAAGISNDGSVFSFGNRVDRGVNAVRPALWINLAS